MADIHTMPLALTPAKPPMMTGSAQGGCVQRLQRLAGRAWASDLLDEMLVLIGEGCPVHAASSSRMTSAAPSRWLRFAVTSGMVFALVGPAIGFASLLVSGAVSGRMFDSRSHEDLLSVLGGFALLLPAAYLLAFVPAALTGILVSPALSLGWRCLFAVASPLVGAALSCLIVPLVSGQHGGWFRSVVQNAPWLAGCGAAAGLGCAAITLKLT